MRFEVVLTKPHLPASWPCPLTCVPTHQQAPYPQLSYQASSISNGTRLSASSGKPQENNRQDNCGLCCRSLGCHDRLKASYCCVTIGSRQPQSPVSQGSVRGDLMNKSDSSSQCIIKNKIKLNHTLVIKYRYARSPFRYLRLPGRADGTRFCPKCWIVW